MTILACITLVGEHIFSSIGSILVSITTILASIEQLNTPQAQDQKRNFIKKPFFNWERNENKKRSIEKQMHFSWQLQHHPKKFLTVWNILRQNNYCVSMSFIKSLEKRSAYD